MSAAALETLLRPPSAPPAPDPTLSSLTLFDNPANWERVIASVPVFIAHTLPTTDAAGQPRTIVVDAPRLQRIADRINAQYARNGVAVKFQDGHTRDPKTVPQGSQPRILAYGRNARVGPWGPEGKLGILLDLYVRPGCDAEVRERPFRSAEFYDATDEITAVALLRTDPKLDMGMILYAGDKLSCYQGPEGSYYLYSEDLHMAGEVTTQKPDPALAPTVAPEAGIDAAGGKKFQEYMSSVYPGLHGLHDHMTKIHPEGMQAHHYAAMLSGTNGAVPAPGATPPAAATPPACPPTPAAPVPVPGALPMTAPAAERPSKAEQRQRDEMAQQYQQTQAEVAKLRADLQAEQYARAMAESRQLVDELDRDGYLFDAESEVKRMAAMKPEDRAIRESDTRQLSPGGPVGGPIRRADAPTGPNERMTENQAEAAYQYMRDHNCQWEEAVAALRAGKVRAG